MAITVLPPVEELLRVGGEAFTDKEYKVFLCNDTLDVYDENSTVADWKTIEITASGYTEFTYTQSGSYSGPLLTDSPVVAEFTATFSGDASLIFNNVIVYESTSSYPICRSKSDTTVTIGAGSAVQFNIQINLSNTEYPVRLRAFVDEYWPGTRLLLTFEEDFYSGYDSGYYKVPLAGLWTIRPATSVTSKRSKFFSRCLLTTNTIENEVGGLYLNQYIPLDVRGQGFTIEAYIYLLGNHNPSNSRLTIAGLAGATLSEYVLDFYVQYLGGYDYKLAFRFIDSESNALDYTYDELIDENYSIPVKQWCHVAVSRDEANVYLFLNGTLVLSRALDPSVSIAETTNALSVGGLLDGYQNNFHGYIDELRYTIPYARYTESFTLSKFPAFVLEDWEPTDSQPVFYTPVIALLHLDSDFSNTIGAEIITIEEIGTPTISTSVKKFGAGSMALTGSEHEGLYIQHSPLSTEDFNADFWFYYLATQQNSYPTLLKLGNGKVELGVNASTRALYMSLYSDSNVYTSELYFSSNSVTTNTWSHIAVQRTSNTYDLWLNGVQAPNVFNSATISHNLQNYLYLGLYNPGVAGLNGYIDEFRISKGNKYTIGQNFTPPTGPYTIESAS